MQTHALMGNVRLQCLSLLGDYLPDLASLDRLEKLIAPPRLGGDAGILGAFILAQRAYSKAKNS